jgi:hypothetical protein
MRTVVFISFVAILAITGFLWSRQIEDSTALARVQNQCDGLRRELAGRDQSIADLRASIDRLEQAAVANQVAESNRLTQPTAAQAEVARRLADLATVNSNTVALVAKLVGRNAETQTTSETPQERAGTIKGLETSVAEQREKLDAMKKKTSELLESLKVPEEVSTMDPAKALDTANLKTYWPFFEAKRERDSLQLMLERLRTRLAQEKIEARVQEQKTSDQ